MWDKEVANPCYSESFCIVSQGSGGEDEDDQDEIDEESLTEDSTSEHQEELSEVSEKKSQSSSPTQSEQSHFGAPDRDKRKRKLRTFSFSDDENRPPSPKVYFDFKTCNNHQAFQEVSFTKSLTLSLSPSLPP